MSYDIMGQLYFPAHIIAFSHLMKVQILSCCARGLVQCTISDKERVESIRMMRTERSPPDLHCNNTPSDNSITFLITVEARFRDTVSMSTIHTDITQSELR